MKKSNVSSYRRLFLFFFMCFCAAAAGVPDLYSQSSSSDKKTTIKKSPSFFKKLTPSKKTKYQNVPTIVAGVRGIDEPEGTGDVNSRDWESLKKIESYPSVSDEELQNFIKEGGVR